MSKNKWIKFLILNGIICLVNIILFSNAFIHLDMSGASALSLALGITVILMSIFVFVLGNYRLLYPKQVLIQTSVMKTLEDCENALRENLNKKTFANDLEIVLEQIRRFQKKKRTIHDILLQKFSQTEMSYQKFQGIITDVENVFLMNIKSILNRINAFDEEDYHHLLRNQGQGTLSQDFIKSKMSIYNEYIAYVKDSVADNEEILLKFDRMLLEISKFDSLEDGEIENMAAMQEIDELIKNAKWYK